MLATKNEGVSHYLLKSIGREVIHALLLSFVSVPKELCPLQDLCTVQLRALTDDRLILWLKVELRSPGEHDLLQAGNAGLGETGHYFRGWMEEF